MKKAVLAARVLLGLMFLVPALMFFSGKMPHNPMPEAATTYMTGLAASGYTMYVVKVIELVAGITLLAGQFGFDTFARLVGLLLPFAVSYALPMGVLTGVLLTLGRMSADSEITAMRSAGISVVRLARPVFVLGAVCAAAAFYVNFESMPWARQQYYRELAAAVRAKTFIRDFSGTVLYIGEREGPILRDIWIWELDDQQRVKRLTR